MLAAMISLLAAKSAPDSAWPILFIRERALYRSTGTGMRARKLLDNAANPAWSPDRKRILFARGASIYLCDSEGRYERRVFAGPPQEGVEAGSEPLEPIPAWHPTNGRALATVYLSGGGAKSQIMEIDPTGKEKPLILFGPDDDATGFTFSSQAFGAWSRDGMHLAFSRNGDLWMADLTDSKPAARYAWDATRIIAMARYDSPNWRGSRNNLGSGHVSWFPDHKHVAVERRRLQGTGTEELWIVDLTTRKMAKQKARGFHPSVSPDGKWILYRTFDTYGPDPKLRQGIAALEVATGKVVSLIADGEDPDW